MASWYELLIETSEQVIEKIGPDGEKIIIDVGKEVVSFLRDNQDLLSEIGKDAFTEVLSLLKNGQKKEAEDRLLVLLSTDGLIDAMNDNADAVETIAQARDRRNRFLKQLLLMITKSVAKKLLLLLI